MSIWQRSPILRFGHWLGRKLLRWRTVRFLAVLSALIGLFYAEEDWRGKHAWEKFTREGEVKGEHFNREALIPPPIPDEQNFAMIPALAPLFDYEYTSAKMADRMLRNEVQKWGNEDAYQRTQQLSLYRSPNLVGKEESALSERSWEIGKRTNLKAWQSYYRSSTNFPVATTPQDAASDVLLALSKFDDFLSQIRVGAKDRPKARFPIHYDEGPAMLTRHLSTLRSLSKILALRATAELESGRNEAALADVNLCFRLIESIKTEPMLISQLVRVAMLRNILQPVWEGVSAHRWTDQQLESFQKELVAIDFLSDYEWTMRYEYANRISLISDLRRGDLCAPDYVDMFTIITGGTGSRDDSRKQMAPIARTLQLYLASCPSGWLYQDQMEIARFCQNNILSLVDTKEQRVYAKQIRHLEQHAPKITGSIRNCLVDIPEWSATGGGIHFAQGQTARNEAIVACALERYRIHYGRHPDSTEALSPEFIRNLPHDVIDGNPLRYRRTADGQFVLYSVGWDEIDNGGVVDKETHSWGRTGDWAWSYPSATSNSN
jgi:hypothetical protein